MNLHPTISIGLDDPACQNVVEGALRLLDKVGMECRSAAGRDFMARQAGIRASDERVYFDRGFLADYLVQLRDSVQPEKPCDRFSLGPPWTSLNIADVRTGQVRLAGEEDLARAVRLYDALGVHGGLPPIAVGTVPPEHRDLLSTLVCLEHSDSFAGPTDTHAPELLQPFIDMMAVVGRKPKIQTLYIISPLRFDASLVDFCLRYREDDRFEIKYSFSGMPCAGSTAPLAFPAAFCQTLAEGLAGSIFAWLCTGRRKDPGLRLDLFDFKYANYLVGDPASLLFNMASRRLRQYICGRWPSWAALLSMAKWPDAQAIHDHTLSAYLGAMQGATVFGNSGQLAHDEVFSSEIVAIDRDIVASAERFVRGLDWREGPAGVAEASEMVAEGLASGAQFMDHPATLEHFREFAPSEGLFAGSNLGQWRQAGAKSLIDAAADLVDALVAGNRFQRPDEQVRELRSIYWRATRA